MSRISNKFHQEALNKTFFGDFHKCSILKLDNIAPIFSRFNPCPPLQSKATDDKREYQGLNIVLNNKAGPLVLNSIDAKVRFSLLKRQQIAWDMYCLNLIIHEYVCFWLASKSLIWITSFSH